MTSCKVCGNKVRKTVLAMILRDRKLKSARVCLECESKLGVTIVVAREVPCCKKHGNPATKCHLCLDPKSGDLADAIKALKGRLKLMKMTPVEHLAPDQAAHNNGRIEATESIVAMLEGGRF